MTGGAVARDRTVSLANLGMSRFEGRAELDPRRLTVVWLTIRNTASKGLPAAVEISTPSILGAPVQRWIRPARSATMTASPMD
jgi:orotate phosphoribosyltransferase-like protein